MAAPHLKSFLSLFGLRAQLILGSASLAALLWIRISLSPSDGPLGFTGPASGI